MMADCEIHGHSIDQQRLYIKDTSAQ